MKQFILAVLIPLTLVSTISSADAQTKMTKNFFVHNSQKFRRAGAESVTLGAIGLVRKPFGKAYRFEKKASGKSVLKNKRVRVRRVTRVKGKFVNTSSNKFGLIYAGLTLGATKSQLRAGRLDLILFEISSDSNWVQAANKNPRALKQLRDIKPVNALRVVRRVWVVVDAQLYNEFEGKLKGLAVIEGLVLKTDNDGTSNASFSISPRSIFAYEIAKVKWKDNGKVDRLKVDRANM